ncbi:anoctamin-8 [Ixodes scapularis]|uniref:anoctamin-8 n=1 Tax=Ixodes scapularis TaxID=6945 RepID=UPI001A9E1D23|nr:anoctamin-8 [Ixodes scapularis]
MEPRLRKHRKTMKFSLLSAGRLVGRRWQVSKQLLAASQCWNRTLPSHGCDVVLTFPPGTPASTTDWFHDRIRDRVPQLAINIRHHAQSGSVGFYFTADYDSLLRGAEELKLRKLVKEEFGGGHKEFLYEEQGCFEGVQDSEHFLSSQERQSIVFYFLNSLRAREGDVLQGVYFMEGQSIVQRCLSENLVSQVLPLHHTGDLNRLKRDWVLAFLKLQPLDDICSYFGVKIAIYFAWLGHYTWALIVPAVAGTALFLLCYWSTQATEDLCFVLFSLLNMLWATLYLESWKRYSAELAYHWGTLDSQSELLTEPRPQFTGPPGRSPVTGRLEPMYPSWKRNLFRYLVSVPTVTLCLVVVVASMFLVFEFQAWWDERTLKRHCPLASSLSFVPKVLLALIINVLDTVYYRIALWLNDKENYRLDEDYENQLIIKIAVFQFINSFLSLFYIAFYLQDMDKLQEQLAALLITRQVVGNIKESVIPFLTERIHLACLEVNAATPEHRAHRTSHEPETEGPKMASKAPEDANNGDGTPRRKPRLTQAEVECAMYKYEGTFEDYLEMFIQFGYVVLFSSAFPLAALCALLNNVVEVRSDAFKLCMIFQRPFGQSAENIGTWQAAMEVMGVLAVMVNCALIGMSGQIHRLFPSLTTTGTVLLIVGLEHVMLFLKFAIAQAIPDIPQWVATEMAKVEYHRREAAKLQSATLWKMDKRTSTVGLGVEEQVAAACQTSPTMSQMASPTVEETDNVELPSPTLKDGLGLVRQPSDAVEDDEQAPSSSSVRKARSSSLSDWANRLLRLRGRSMESDGLPRRRRHVSGSPQPH